MQAHEKVGGNLRPPTPSEQAAIRRAVEKCGATLPAKYLFLVHDLEYREVYAFHDRAVFNTAKQISERRNVYFAGLFAGSFRGERFKLSLEMAEHLYRVGCLRNVVVVDEEQERRFLYGRDIRLKKPENRSAGSVVLVVNSLGDVLGLARYEGEALVNLVDKGWYLRKGH